MTMIDVKDKHVFLSGPMTACKHYNVEAFARAHAILKELGAEHVYNPALEWLFDEGETKPHSYYMRVCIAELARPRWYGLMNETPQYDMLISLPGWELSDGAMCERQAAGWFGIPCYDFEEVFGAQ